MSFRIGSLEQEIEGFLTKEGMHSPYDVKLSWGSIPVGFLPVVIILNVISKFAEIAVNKEDLDRLTDLHDERAREIFLLRIETLLKVGGQNFINYVKNNKLASDEIIQKAELEEKERLAKIIELVFSGRPGMLGGLSNEEALARACPENFRRDNPWSEYAMNLFYCGAEISNWKFISSDEKEKTKQFRCFQGLLGSFGIRHEDKESVAGWMLSLMLEKVPQHIPVKSN
jgi:hypothetical protein